MFSAACSTSGYWITLASEVALTMPMNSLPSGGSTTRIACGKMIRRRALSRPIPIAEAGDHIAGREVENLHMWSARWPGPDDDFRFAIVSKVGCGDRNAAAKIGIEGHEVHEHDTGLAIVNADMRPAIFPRGNQQVRPIIAIDIARRKFNSALKRLLEGDETSERAESLPRG